MMNVNNLPAYAFAHHWIVARDIDGALWFYGAYDDREKADKVAETVSGIVVENSAA